MKHPGLINKSTADQPDNFEWTKESLDKINTIIKRYPLNKQQRAVLPLLDLAQRQNAGWLPQKAIEKVAETLKMSFIRVMEVATFYSMFNLEPIGKNFIQICRTTPCWLRGSDDILKAIYDTLKIKPNENSAPGNFEILFIIPRKKILNNIGPRRLP